MPDLLKKFELVYEVLWGTDVKPALAEGITIANRERKTVTLLFRDIEILIAPDATFEEAYRAWCQLVRPKLLAG